MDVEVGLCWLGGGGEWIKWILGVELCGEGEEVLVFVVCCEFCVGVVVGW